MQKYLKSFWLDCPARVLTETPAGPLCILFDAAWGVSPAATVSLVDCLHGFELQLVELSAHACFALKLATMVPACATG